MKKHSKIRLHPRYGTLSWEAANIDSIPAFIVTLGQEEGREIRKELDFAEVWLVQVQKSTKQ